MKIEVLGMGCKKCTSLYDNVNEALKQLGISAEVEKVSDMQKIMGYGVMSTPALVIDGQVKFTGGSPAFPELMDVIAKSK